MLHGKQFYTDIFDYLKTINWKIIGRNFQLHVNNKSLQKEIIIHV